ncbi:MAG: outer membrane beta-barrel protein [Ferruginibacter sp.]
MIDDYGDQSAFTGVKDGDPTKTLNIQLKKDKNKGYFGNITAGGGTKDRYLTSLSVNRFNNTRQISIFGNMNNTNASTFNFSNLPGGMGAMAGGMIRSFGGAAGSAFAGFGNNDGVGVTKSLGMNYRDELSPKVSVYGSYSLSQKAITVINDINQQLIQKDTVFPNIQNTRDYSVTDNHRFSFNVEYKIDSFNYLKFNPGFTYKKVADSYRSDFTYFDPKGAVLNTGFNTDENNSKAPNFTGSLLFNHRFHKKGRTLSLNLTAGKSSIDGDDIIYNNSVFYNPNFPGNNQGFNSVITQDVMQQNDNHNYGFNASLNEQLSKKHSLEFNYAHNKRFTGNDKETFDLQGPKTIIDSLTNIYENNYTTNRFGANFRTTTKKYNYSVGLAVQPATIVSNSLTTKQSSYEQHIVNYYPVVRFAYNFSKSRSFNLNYNGSTTQPTYQQSQPVFDYSNRQNIVIGNPDLRPEFSNTISMRYNNFDFISGNVFFGNISASFTRDKIVSNVIRRNFSSLQETRYLNADGYYNVNMFYAVSKPLQNRKYVFNLGGTINYNNNISYSNSEKNTGKNILVSQRFSMDYKLKKWLELSGGANFALNDVKYSLSTANNSSAKTWSLTNASRMFFQHDWILSYDLEKTLYSGYGLAADPLIINATLEKQFLKKKNASLKLQGLDLLNENTNVNRSVSNNYITNTRTNRLTRYFMLSFVFRFSKFDGSKTGPANMQQMGSGGHMRMMGM